MALTITKEHTLTDERNTAILALVEKIKRQDMTVFEEAEAIEKLISSCGLTQEDAAAKLGRAQSTIANKLRLLRLTDDERELIMSSGLTERHARALLKLGSSEERIGILEKVVTEGLNVERTEQLIEEYIGNSGASHTVRKRSKSLHNVKMFVNTINKAVESMQAAGIAADSCRIQSDEYIEYHVRIPVSGGKH